MPLICCLGKAFTGELGVRVMEIGTVDSVLLLCLRIVNEGVRGQPVHRVRVRGERASFVYSWDSMSAGSTLTLCKEYKSNEKDPAFPNNYPFTLP